MYNSTKFYLLIISVLRYACISNLHFILFAFISTRQYVFNDPYLSVIVCDCTAFVGERGLLCLIVLK